MSNDGAIDFKPMRVPPGRGGHIALTIYPPGTWFGNTAYHVFVGGCGYGERPTLAEARTFLMECAKEYCSRQIIEAEKVAAHYRAEAERLHAVGLVPA